MKSLPLTALRAVRRLASNPIAIEYLVSKPIVEIADDGIRELEDAVREGRELGLLKPQPLSRVSDGLASTTGKYQFVVPG
jgi:hypothetical protein